MPTYEYACTACGHRHEEVQSFTDPVLTECPECHGALRKVFSAVGVVFKGSGFYKTDSRAAAKASESKASESKGGESKGGDAKKDDTKKGESKAGESKPATKTESSTSSTTSSTPSKAASPA